MTICWGLHNILNEFHLAHILVDFVFYFVYSSSRPGINLNNFRFWRQWSGCLECVCICGLWQVLFGILRWSGQLSGLLGLEPHSAIKISINLIIINICWLPTPFATIRMSYSCACGYAMINLWPSMGVVKSSQSLPKCCNIHLESLHTYIYLCGIRNQSQLLKYAS